MNQSGVERRRAPRAQATIPIQLSMQAGAGPATIRDISKSGLCCASQEPIREMTMVRIDVKFPGAHDVHRIDGVVVRCEKRRGQSPPSYDIAVYFAEMNEAARRSVEAFVAASLRENPVKSSPGT